MMGKFTSNLSNQSWKSTGKNCTFQSKLMGWSKKSLYLHPKSHLFYEKEEIDLVSIPFGVRSFSVDSQKGFILNETQLPLRGVSKHQDSQHKGWATS